MGLALSNNDSIGVIFYILKLENTSKTVLGEEKKAWALKMKVGCIKNMLTVLKAFFPIPQHFFLPCPYPITYWLIDFFFCRLAIFILLQGCILILLILQSNKAFDTFVHLFSAGEWTARKQTPPESLHRWLSLWNQIGGNSKASNVQHSW